MTNKKKAAGSPAAAQAITHPESTKIARVLTELRAGRSLNRFEAERIGDHALNSTIATLRAEGYRIVDEWELVPTRFSKSARVKRYRYAGKIRGVEGSNGL